MSDNFWGSDSTPTTPSNESAKVEKVHEGGNKLRMFLMGLGAFSLIGWGAGGVYYGIKTKPEWFGIKTANQTANQAQAQVASEVAKVNKLIELPAGETPTLAKVTDISKVKDQNFFRNAKEGDEILVYTTAKRAYLYRPSENRIIEVGVVNIPAPSGGAPQGQTAGASIEITEAPSKAPLKTTTVTPVPSLTVTPTP